MWQRSVEVMIALWLLMSPFVFRHDDAWIALWASDFTSAAVIALCSLLSFWERTRRAHLLNLVVAAWLMGFGYFAGGYPSAAGYQNELIVGLVLVLFAIIPNESTQPPRSWRSYYEEKAKASQR